MGVVNAETRTEAACGRCDMRRISGQKDTPFTEAFRHPGTNYPRVVAKHSERSLADAKGPGDDRPAIGFAEVHLHVCGRVIFDAGDAAILICFPGNVSAKIGFAHVNEGKRPPADQWLQISLEADLHAVRQIAETGAGDTQQMTNAAAVSVGSDHILRPHLLLFPGSSVADPCDHTVAVLREALQFGPKAKVGA